MFPLLLDAMVLCLLISSFALPHPVPAPVARDVTGATTSDTTLTRQAPSTQVLILGGGVAGIIAARTLAAQGITDFLIVEGRNELGGRARSATFGAPNRQMTIELGANWIHGTQEGDNPPNPIFDLALKYDLKTADNDPLTSTSASTLNILFLFLFGHNI